MNVFINAFNTKAGGGVTILINLLSVLSEIRQSHTNYYVLVPPGRDYFVFNKGNIHILQFPGFYYINALFPFVHTYLIPRLIERKKCSLVFNLADIVIPSAARQIYLFDWSYAVFPDSPVWEKMDYGSLLKRKMKLYYFKKYLGQADVIIAQTPIMKRRLESLYNVKSISVIPNAISRENYINVQTRNFNLPSGLNLLCLTHYYPHKNLEILIPLAREILSRGLPINVIVTIDPKQHAGAKNFLKRIGNNSLNAVIRNIGPVALPDVPSLYRQTDGLLLPTLLESFSGTYVEAMFHRRPIYTSDLDFAKGVCFDAAYYFDPMNANDILDKIISSQCNPAEMQRKIEEGTKVLGTLPNWETVVRSYIKLFQIN